MQLGFCEQGQVVESKMKETDGQGTAAGKENQKRIQLLLLFYNLESSLCSAECTGKQQSSLETV